MSPMSPPPVQGHGYAQRHASPMPISRRHIVPTHLNLPDQVLSVWSLGLSTRQLLLLLVGAGMGGSTWQRLAWLGPGHAGVFGVAQGVLRLGVALLPFALMLVLACYRHAGRYLEVWLIVLLRYRLQPTRFLWRTSRMCSGTHAGSRSHSRASTRTDADDAHLSLFPFPPDEHAAGSEEEAASLGAVGHAERRRR